MNSGIPWRARKKGSPATVEAGRRMQRGVAKFEAGQYWLHEKGRFDDFMQLDFTQGNGLIVRTGSFIAVLCGTEFGAASVDLNWLTEDPGPPDLDPWKPVEEHFIQAWPASTAREMTYKLTDAFGSRFRRRKSGKLRSPEPDEVAESSRSAPIHSESGRFLGRGEGYAPPS